jgi:hypothetical protein
MRTWIVCWLGLYNSARPGAPTADWGMCRSSAPQFIRETRARSAAISIPAISREDRWGILYLVSNWTLRDMSPANGRSQITVGVLALQGSFSEHTQTLKKAAASLASNDQVPVLWAFLEVRTAAELDRCDALIIPGGESTAISLVAERSGLLELLRNFVK